MRRGIAVAPLAVLSVLAGCSARAVDEAPVISPTGIVYPRGTPPAPTRRSQTATLFLRQDRPERALELLLEGIEDDPENPIHYFLAGITHSRLGHYMDADRMFGSAQRLYPAYELQIELEREAAWGQAFNDGLEAYRIGDTERAIELWQAATVLYDLRPEAHRNLASLLTGERRYAEAIAVYRSALSGLSKRPATRELTAVEVSERERDRVELNESLGELLLATERFAEAEPILREQLAREPGSVQARIGLATALTGQGRATEADRIYATLLSETGLGADPLYRIGTALFRSASYTRAADAFAQLTQLLPRSRDAWFNYANSLFAAEDWEALASVGPRLVELDPLGEGSGLITARAQLETGDREAALQTLAGLDEAPVYLNELQLQRAGAATTVSGHVSGNVAEEDTPVRLRFSFYTSAGDLLGTETLTVPAPGPDDARDLEVEFAGPADAYSYELIL